MNSFTPQAIYDELQLLDQMDISQGADLRQVAQSVLADAQVNLNWRQAIADRLNRANHSLELITVGSEDSY